MDHDRGSGFPRGRGRRLGWPSPRSGPLRRRVPAGYPRPRWLLDALLIRPVSSQPTATPQLPPLSGRPWLAGGALFICPATSLVASPRRIGGAAALTSPPALSPPRW